MLTEGSGLSLDVIADGVSLSSHISLIFNGIAYLLTFMCPCFTSTARNDDQHDAAICDLFNSSLLYMFRATLSPIIRST
jgi:hypothetical protein